jgi:hypothetical protein
MYEVVDDDGFMAILDPHAYASFVDDDATFDEIEANYIAHMGAHSLLIWGTGMENEWNVEVSFSRSVRTGYREVVGSLRSSEGLLCLSDHGTLGEAAISQSYTIAPPDQHDLYIKVEPGLYQCRIVQLYEPMSDDKPSEDGPDFLIELQKTDDELAPWQSIPWS